MFRSLAPGGGKEIRTPDIQLAKLALYQLSYAPKPGFFFRGEKKIKVKLCAAPFIVRVSKKPF